MKHSQYANNLLSIKSGEDSLRAYTAFIFHIRCVGTLFWLLDAFGQSFHTFRYILACQFLLGNGTLPYVCSVNF